MAGTNASMLDGAFVELRPFKNGDSSDLPGGSVVMPDFDSEDGLTGGAPNASCAVAMGILLKGVEAGAQSNAALAVEGVVLCRFKNHASADVGTYARPVPGQTYLTYSPTPTPFVLLTDQSSGTDVHGLDDGEDAPSVLILPSLRGGPAHLYWDAPVVADTDLLLADEATSNTETTEITTFDAQPDVARQISITPGGTTESVPEGDVTVVGTDIHGNALTDTVTFSANASSASTTSEAFKTVTSITFPIQDGSGATYNVGITDKLGLPFGVPTDVQIRAALDGALESDAPTLTADIEATGCLVELDSSLDGSNVDLWLDRG